MRHFGDDQAEVGGDLGWWKQELIVDIHFSRLTTIMILVK